MQSHEAPVCKTHVSLRITFGRRGNMPRVLRWWWSDLKWKSCLTTVYSDQRRNYAKSSLNFWDWKWKMALMWCARVWNLQTGSSYIWGCITRPVLALQISAAIIWKFESNKQTKHNLFLAHSQILLLHRFPRLQYPQSAISLPGKNKDNCKEGEPLLDNERKDMELLWDQCSCTCPANKGRDCHLLNYGCSGSVYCSEIKLTSPSPSPKSNRKGKDQFGLWAVSKIL